MDRLRYGKASASADTVKDSSYKQKREPQQKYDNRSVSNNTVGLKLVLQWFKIFS